MADADNIGSGGPRIMLVSIFDPTALGLRSVHASLSAKGHDCELVVFRTRHDTESFMHSPRGTTDWPSETEYRLFAGLVARRKPDVVGISFRSFALPIVERLTREAREAAGPLVVWGGTHPTLLPEECIETADVVCVGEGEGPMLDLASALARKGRYDRIDNLWVRSGKEVHRNSLRPLNQDLDALPFPVIGNEGKFFIDRDELRDADPYLGGGEPIVYSISCSRGCPYSCDFCCNASFKRLYQGLGKYLRKRSVENVIEELTLAYERLDVQTVAFQDEVFSLDKKWGLELMSAFGKRLKRRVIIDLHPLNVDDEFASAAWEAGLRVAHMGVQSGSERSRRDNFHRLEKKSDIIDAALAFRRAKVTAYFDFIFDNPFETEEDLKETMEFILTLPRPHNVKILSLCYFYGTRISERAIEEGFITENDLDHKSGKSLTHIWGNAFKAIDKNNAFYISLAWLETLKYSRNYMALTFFADRFGDSVHIVPRGTVKRVMKSRFLKNHPLILYRSLSLSYRAGNRILSLLRLLRSTYRVLRKGGPLEVTRKAWARLGGKTA